MSQSLPLHVQPGPRHALPDIVGALAWRGWPKGLAEARRRKAPILALAELPWTNSAQRLAYVLGQDDRLRELLEDRLIPVRLDPIERPDLAARWRWASIALTGSSGPPLLMLLTHEGLPFLSYCSMWPEGRPPYPSLASLVQATCEAYARDPVPFVAEARELTARAEQPTSARNSSPLDLWHSLVGEIDEAQGGLKESPKHPHPQLLWLLMDVAETGEAPAAGEFVRRTLAGMVRGGINDQLADGFHRCSRDERWVVPHFEKPVPLNAQLAAVYARAGELWDVAEFRAVAEALVSFCSTALRRSVDALGSNSEFYTWTSREVLDHLDPAFVQAVSFYYHITPDSSRQVLYRALEPEAMDRYSHEAPDALRKRIEEGRRQLRWVRSQRPAPAPVRVPALCWGAQTIHWLLTAAEHGCSVSDAELVGGLQRLTADRWQDGVGYVRAADEQALPRGWLEDQAALLAAMVSVYRATAAARWLDDARRLADVIVGRYVDERGWLDRLDGGDDARRSWAVADDMLPSAIATASDALCTLGDIVGERRYAEQAYRAVAQHLAALQTSAHSGGALWRAWFRLHGETDQRPA